MTNGNGVTMQEVAGLPPTREAVVEQGLRIQQETAAANDHLRREVSGLKSDIAGYKVAIEALQSQVEQAESRARSMVMERDEAVRRQAKLETVLGSMLALGRAFQIKSEPLITGNGDHEDVSTMSANDRAMALGAAGSPARYNRGDVG